MPDAKFVATRNRRRELTGRVLEALKGATVRECEGVLIDAKRELEFTAKAAPVNGFATEFSVIEPEPSDAIT